MDTSAPDSAAALYQRHQALRQRLHALEGERGQAVLQGDAALARLHQRAAEVERDQRDLTAGIAALDPLLDAARDREQQQARDELRETGLQLCQQRLQAAGDVDRA
jgi:hypothetical protein